MKDEPCDAAQYDQSCVTKSADEQNRNFDYTYYFKNGVETSCNDSAKPLR